jgi:hypothetical protein
MSTIFWCVAADGDEHDYTAWLLKARTVEHEGQQRKTLKRIVASDLFFHPAVISGMVTSYMF